MEFASLSQMALEKVLHVVLGRSRACSFVFDEIEMEMSGASGSPRRSLYRLHTPSLIPQLPEVPLCWEQDRVVGAPITIELGGTRSWGGSTVRSTSPTINKGRLIARS